MHPSQCRTHLSQYHPRDRLPPGAGREEATAGAAAAAPTAVRVVVARAVRTVAVRAAGLVAEGG